MNSERYVPALSRRHVLLSLMFVSLLQACGGGSETPTDYGEDAAIGSTRQAVTATMSCQVAAWNGTEYRICDGLRTWSAARDYCASLGTKLLKLNSKAENDFIQSKVRFAAWTGGSTPSIGGTKWSWQFDNSQFWTSGWTPGSGKAVNGAYTNWDSFEPAFGGTCLALDAITNKWHAGACGVPLGFVCENPDTCPNDPLKTAPGKCGCGRADIDLDKNGIVDCLQVTRPGDPNETDPAVIAIATRPQSDTTQGAISFVDGTLSMGGYYCLAVDRSDKRNAIFASPSLAAAILAGDVDGDLVPDSLDQCQDTPPLTPTNDAGCSEVCTMTFSAEDEKTVREAVGDWEIIKDNTRTKTDCATVIPDTPEMLAGYANNTFLDPNTVAIFFQFTRPTCPVRLRIEISTNAATGWPFGGARVLYFEPGPRDFGNAISGNTPIDGAMSVLLRAPEFKDIFTNLWTAIPDPDGKDASGTVVNPSPRVLARAMAVYGNGKTSSWSNYVQVRTYGSRR